jgi:hypothetical protein
LSRCGDQEARSSYETGDEKGRMRIENPRVNRLPTQTAKGIRTGSLAQR